MRFNKKILVDKDGKIPLNQWHLQFQFISTRYMHQHQLDLGWYCVEIGLFKLVNLPPEGCALTLADKKGFCWQLFFWLPIKVQNFFW